MGLGKTVQALAVATAYRSKWPLLIVCPSSVRFTWQEAVVRWVPSLPEEDIVVVTSGKDEWRGCAARGGVVIVSYDLLPRREAEFVRQGFRMAVLDESHFVKNGKAARSKAATEVVGGAEHLVLLSGTPALSRPIELFHQLHLLLPRLFPYAKQFGMRYCDGKVVSFGPDRGSHYNFQGSSHMEELRILLEET